jgi:hypothetical protein
LIKLRPSQEEFVNNFERVSALRTLLVAAPGTGKAITAAVAADHLLYNGSVQRVLIFTPTRMLVDQWRSILGQFGHEHSADPAHIPFARFTVTTFAKLRHLGRGIWRDIPRGLRFLLILDEAPWQSGWLESFVNDATQVYPGSRVLFLASKAAPVDADIRFELTSEFFEGKVLEEPTTKRHLRLHAPSFELLQQVQRDLMSLDDLSWREFEKLIAQMLERDGYKVDLMQGTKDGGVDVVAIKDLGSAGHFKSVWQAKKNRADRKVGLSLVRELADTRLEHGASKAIIVTTSHLTAGALRRVERDRYLLGKMDRDDLNAWLHRNLREV